MVGVLLLGFAAFTVGTLVAFNIRGLADRQEQAALRRTQHLKNFWPWRSMVIPTDTDGFPYRDRLRGVNRPIGAGLAVLGFVVMVASLVGAL